MSFWSGQTLVARAKSEALIEPFDAGQVSCSAYELKVGDEAFVTRDKEDQSLEISQGRTPGHLTPGTNGSICIPSGQFAFLITEERVRVPDDAIGLISIKASRKWQGLVNVSGFHVDPGWQGRLIFSVFNAGPQTIVIKPGEQFFLLFYASLDNTAGPQHRYNNGHRFSGIPSNLMQSMSTSVPTVYKLNDKVRELREDVKGAQNRSTIALTLGLVSITIALAIFSKVLFFSPGIASPANHGVREASGQTVAGSRLPSGRPAMPAHNSDNPSGTAHGAQRAPNP